MKQETKIVDVIILTITYSKFLMHSLRFASWVKNTNLCVFYHPIYMEIETKLSAVVTLKII